MILSIFLSCCLLFTSTNIDFNESNTNILSKAQSIGFDSKNLTIKSAKDFVQNDFLIGEAKDEGYFIYSYGLDEIVEYSNSSISPYYSYNENLIYSGATNYFIENNDNYYSIIDKKYYEKSKIKKVPAINVSKEDTKKARSSEPVVTNYSIKHPEFYSQMCKDNIGYYEVGDGICGFIGLGLLIGYQDTYYNNDLMDDKFYENSDYKQGLRSKENSISKYLYDLNPKSSTTSKHIKTVMKQYASIRNVSIDYTSRWVPFFTENMILEAIKNDTPVELFGNYDFIDNVSDKDVNGHAIVAYGAKVEGKTCKYRCHFGWSGRSDVTITSCVIGSIFYFNMG